MTDSSTGTRTFDRLPPPEPGERSIGLLADTHGWLDPALAAHFAGAEHLVHAGDVGSQAVLAELAAIAPVTAVRGNIDGGALFDLPLSAVITVAGKRLAALHIAGSPTRPNAAARALVAAERPDLLVVGHSHIAVAGRTLGTLWVNPGAAGRQGFHERRTAALLRVGPDGRLRLFEIDLGPRGTVAGRGDAQPGDGYPRPTSPGSGRRRGGSSSPGVGAGDDG